MLGKTGETIKAREMIYKAVVQEVLMYGIERWVVMDVMMTVLEGFHHSISRQIVEITVWRGNIREWEGDLVNAALEVTWLRPTRDYVRRRQAIIAKYVAGRSI